ncbi:hypothetical protein D3C72_1817280 [compost metagenome]
MGNDDQRVASVQVVGLLGGRPAQAINQHAVAAYQLVGIAHLEGNPKRRTGPQETDLARVQQGLDRCIKCRGRIQRAHRTHGLYLVVRQHVMAGSGGVAGGDARGSL